MKTFILSDTKLPINSSLPVLLLFDIFTDVIAVIAKGWVDFASLISCCAPGLCFLVVLALSFLVLEAVNGQTHSFDCLQLVWVSLLASFSF